MNGNPEHTPLDRYLSKTDVWAMAFGLMVGWGVFAMPGTTLLPVAGPLGTVLAMVIGMVILLVIASNFSYLMGRTPMTGGVYSYTKEAFGRDHAFISSWFLCLSYLTIVFLNGTALFFVIRILLSRTILHGSLSYTIAGNTIYLGETAASVAVLVGVGALFVAAKPLLQRLHTVLSLTLFGGIVIIAVACLPRILSGGALFDFGLRGLNPGYAVFSVVTLAPWAFVGFEVTAFDTAHFRLSNAYKFTPEGGTISASLFEVGANEQGYGAYEMRIRDNGIGMSKEFAEKMFHAFERERTSTVSGVEGTGLGLAITKSIVDLMAGTIEVLTAPGTGTEMIIRMKLRLARAEDVQQPRRSDEAEAAASNLAGRRMLLVEDNLINMEIAREILRQQGCLVETAENGRIAVDMVKAAPAGQYDLILMDIQMPVMDGYAATRAIRLLDDPKKAFIPVIAMTANAFREDEEAAMAAGMQAHIAKPIDIDAMLTTLQRVLRETV